MALIRVTSGKDGKTYDEQYILIYSLFVTNYRSLLVNAKGLRTALSYFINESVSVK